MGDKFKQVKPKRISDEIVEQIKALVLEGGLEPGEELPSERKLATILNVSRVSLREALNTLQGMGMVEIQHGNRTCVTPITSQSISNPLISFLKSAPSNVLKILEIRKYLEIGCAALAAERATSKEIEQIKKILVQMEGDIEENRLGAKSDIQFHAALAKATHNIAYEHSLYTISNIVQSEYYTSMTHVLEDQKLRKELLTHHENVFKAVEQHDPKKASDTMLAHMEFVEENWEIFFNKKS